MVHGPQRVAAIAAALVLAWTVPARADCYTEAAARYLVHPDVLRAIADVESGGNMAAVNTNADGSQDHCAMQINDRNITELKRFGISLEHIKTHECTCVHAGAWVLSRMIARYGNTWYAVARYNTSNPKIGRAYAMKVYKHFQRRTAAPPPQTAADNGPLLDPKQR